MNISERNLGLIAQLRPQTRDRISNKFEIRAKIYPPSVSTEFEEVFTVVLL